MPELAESEALLRAVLDSAPYGFVLTRGDTVLYFNESAAALLGYDPQDLPTMESAYEAFYPDPTYRAEVAELWRRAIEDPAGAEEVVARVRCKDGGTRVVSFSPPVALPDGRLCTAFRDVSAREGDREALVHSTRVLAAFSNAARDFALFRLRLDPSDPARFDVDFTTPSCAELIGVEDTSDVRAVSRTLCAEDRVEAGRLGAALRGGQRDMDRIFRVFHRPTGQWRHIHAVATVQEEEQGWPVLAGVLTDVTDKERAVAERRELEARLRRARELEALGALAGGVAHDFNNLLMAIQGHVSLALVEAPDESPVAGRLRAVEEQVRSGTELTEQLLGYARTGSAQARPTDIGRLVSRTGGAFARTRKRIEVECAPPRTTCVAVVDPHKIELALLNLLVNAADALPEGGTVHISTTLTEPAEGEKGAGAPVTPSVEIAVRDDGVGMDEETKERIFDAFFTTKPHGKGTGLGLSAVRSIVHAHGGTLAVDSKRDEGSTFTIRLPASEVATEVEEPPPEDEIAEGTETVLVVDDEPGNLKVVSEMLKTLGYEALTASSGATALHLLEGRGEDIHVVLLDLVMPAMGGHETYRRLRKLDPAVPVVFTTGLAQDEPVAALVERGQASFVVKPFNLRDLSLAVRRALDAQKRPQR